jgi:hypothetical protein
MLSDALPETTRKLMEFLEINGRHEISEQFNRLALTSQKLNGDPNLFSFVVQLLPLLTPEAARQLPFLDWEELIVPIDKGTIQLNIDDFGRVSSVYVVQLPEIFIQLKGLVGYIG